MRRRPPIGASGDVDGWCRKRTLEVRGPRLRVDDGVRSGDDGVRSGEDGVGEWGLIRHARAGGHHEACSLVTATIFDVPGTVLWGTSVCCAVGGCWEIRGPRLRGDDGGGTGTTEGELGRRSKERGRRRRSGNCSVMPAQAGITILVVWTGRPLLTSPERCCWGTSVCCAVGGCWEVRGPRLRGDDGRGAGTTEWGVEDGRKAGMTEGVLEVVGES